MYLFQVRTAKLHVVSHSFTLYRCEIVLDTYYTYYIYTYVVNIADSLGQSFMQFDVFEM